MGKHLKSLDHDILSRITRKGHGYVFTPADLLDLGNRNAVGQILLRNCRAGTIRKLARGLYDYPRQHSRLGTLPPSIDDIARALQGKDASRLQPSGAHAANMLGLSNQVPVRAVFLTDGRSRKVQIGQQMIILKKTTPRQMITTGRIGGTVIQALRWLGQRNVDDNLIAKLKRKLPNRDKQRLLEDVRYAPVWIGNVMRRVAGKMAR